jgi:predicted N-acetyltransferase YhbS
MTASLANLTIAPALPADLPALTELACIAFGEESRELATEEFASGFLPGARSPLFVLVAKDGETPIGLVGIMEDYLYIDTFTLCWVAVAPAYRRQGLGSALIQAAIAYAATLLRREQGSIILVAAEDKIAYYQRFGFEGSTPIHPYVNNPQPHVLLTRRLTP